MIAPSGAPEDFTYTLEDTVVFLEWMPPAEDERNGVIISYTLTCMVDSTDILEYTMKGRRQQMYLGVYEEEADYSCDILASTSVGDGPTASVSFTTGGKLVSLSHLRFIHLPLQIQVLLSTSRSFLWTCCMRIQMELISLLLMI